MTSLRSTTTTTWEDGGRREAPSSFEQTAKSARGGKKEAQEREREAHAAGGVARSELRTWGTNWDLKNRAPEPTALSESRYRFDVTDDRWMRGRRSVARSGVWSLDSLLSKAEPKAKMVTGGQYRSNELPLPVPLSRSTETKSGDHWARLGKVWIGISLQRTGTKRLVVVMMMAAAPVLDGPARLSIFLPGFIQASSVRRMGFRARNLLNSKPSHTDQAASVITTESWTRRSNIRVLATRCVTQDIPQHPIEPASEASDASAMLRTCRISLNEFTCSVEVHVSSFNVPGS
ncbi:hypothetical protein DL93DRAFT_2157761 [Clavulina sp. PMI_390]|nr:hypothetical protein DL93DRAFT_2157761 [Clavulina sp. PMI_390]